MKKIIYLFAFLAITSCATPVANRQMQCEDTCLDMNTLDIDVVRQGCTCEPKDDPNRMKFENINLEPNKL